MIVYQTRPDGVFVGYTEADESPLEPGVFLIPAGCIEENPPTFSETQRARWEDGAWVIEDNPELNKTIAAKELVSVEVVNDPIEKLSMFLSANPDVAKLINR